MRFFFFFFFASLCLCLSLSVSVSLSLSLCLSVCLSVSLSLSCLLHPPPPPLHFIILLSTFLSFLFLSFALYLSFISPPPPFFFFSYVIAFCSWRLSPRTRVHSSSLPLDTVRSLLYAPLRKVGRGFSFGALVPSLPSTPTPFCLSRVVSNRLETLLLLLLVMQ